MATLTVDGIFWIKKKTGNAVLPFPGFQPFYSNVIWADPYLCSTAIDLDFGGNCRQVVREDEAYKLSGRFESQIGPNYTVLRVDAESILRIKSAELKPDDTVNKTILHGTGIVTFLRQEPNHFNGPLGSAIYILEMMGGHDDTKVQYRIPRSVYQTQLCHRLVVGHFLTASGIVSAYDRDSKTWTVEVFNTVLHAS